MKRILILLCIPFFAWAQGPQTYVPDNNFEQRLINLGYDGYNLSLPLSAGGLDNYVNTYNINTVTSLDVSSQNISDLTGIEDFDNLQTLNCYQNQLTTLDVSQNTALTSLYCGYNQLTTLDVSNTSLTYLNCYSNQFTTLDVSQNTALEFLLCHYNQLTTLDISQNTALTSLNCYDNNLTSLDVSNNTALDYLSCSKNQLTSLDLSNNTALTELFCRNNQLTSLDVTNNTYLMSLHCYTNQITSLDVSNNTYLTSLLCYSNQLTSLDVRNGNNINMPTSSGYSGFLDFTNNPQLYCIDVDDATYSDGNWTVANGNISWWNGFSNNCATAIYGCTDSSASNYDLTATFNYGCDYGMTYVPDDNFEQILINIGLDSGPLNDSVATANIKFLPSLNVTYQNISDLTGIEDFTALTYLNCRNNLLTSLDVSGATALTTLYCHNNQLTTLDVSGATALTTLYCDNNQLTTLDVRNGNNTNFINFSSLNNPNLYCIDVDATVYSATNWTSIDPWSAFSTNCSLAGCIDSLACNYDPLAWISDSSCGYPTSSTSYITACDTYTWDGITYTASGAYTNTYTNVAGCDSTHTLNLTINNSTTGSSLVTACDTYTWDGITYTASGVYTNTYTNVTGCDSVHTLDLTINYSPATSIILGNNQVYHLSTETYSVAQNIGSIFNWQLDGGGIIINGQTTNSINIQWGFNSGTYVLYVIETALNGCIGDTVFYSVNLACLSSTSTTSVTNCNDYTWNGTTYTSSGTYSWTGTNIDDCDSTATLNLTITNSTTSLEDATSCDSYTWNGQTYTTRGTYTWAGINSVGCDSIATLNLTMVDTIFIDQNGDSLYSIVNPSGVDYVAQWLNIDTETGETWLMGEDKNFGPRFDCNYILVTTTEDGCIDTTDVFFFAEFAGQIYDLKISPNPTRDLLNIKYVNERNQFVRIYFANSNGVVLDEFISSENEMNINISNYPSGIYYVYFSSEEHCSSAEQQISRKIILNK